MARITSLSLLLLLLGTACQGGEGRVLVSFSWGEIDPPEPIWLFGRVVETNGSGTHRLLSEAAPVLYEPGLAFELAGVPNGDNLVVILEARTEESSESRPLYYGLSKPFSLHPGEETTMPSAVALEPAPTLSDLVVAQAVGPADCPTCWVPQNLVSLTFAAQDATAVELANDNAFTLCPRLLSPTNATTDGPALQAQGSAWQLTNWDLDCAVTDTTDGPRSLYARLRDSQGYLSQTLTWVGNLDRQPPTEETLVHADGGTIFAVEGEGHLDARMVFSVLDADEMWIEACEDSPGEPVAGVAVQGGLLPCDPSSRHQVAVAEWTRLTTQGCVRLKDSSVRQLRVKYRDWAHNETPWARYQFDSVSTVKLTWVPIPGGSFMMGCSPKDEECLDSEKPPHHVVVAPFSMLEAEVTEAQWTAVMGTGTPPCDYNAGGGPDSPMECINWNQANLFCELVNARLPTEAEWEYAARAGTTTRYYCGDDSSCLDEIAWYSATAGGHKHDVKGKAPNSFGLYDTLGNVWEWVGDCWHADYSAAPASGLPAWNHDCGDLLRVMRGGVFFNYADVIRVSNRYFDSPFYYFGGLGFRCARSE